MHFAKEKEFLLKLLLTIENALRPVFATSPTPSPTRPLHVPYVPYKFPQRGEILFFGFKQRVGRDGRARLCN